MKKIISIAVLLFVCCFAFTSIATAQSTITFNVDITDNCSPDQEYHGVAWVERLNYGNYCYTTQLTPDPIIGTGINSVSFSCGVPIDAENRIYKIHVYLQSVEEPHCDGFGISTDWMTTDELYGLSVPDISVTID